MSRSGRALLGVLALVPPSTVDVLARDWVRAFLRSASVLRDPVARATLTADAALVVTQLGAS
jgi:hypothetical protein